MVRHRPDPGPRGNAVTAPVLRCEQLRKTYDDLVAVDEVSFSIAPGET